MFPFKTILCPTDFSEPSTCGLKMANEFALKFGSEIILLNIHRPVPHLPQPRIETADLNFDMSVYESHVAEEAKNNLARFASSILDDSITPRLEIRMGRPAKEILAFAEEQNVGAIFIATHGRTGLAHMVFGSVAEMVVRYAKCPVLTIRSCDAAASAAPGGATGRPSAIHHVMPCSRWAAPARLRAPLRYRPRTSVRWPSRQTSTKGCCGSR